MDDNPSKENPPADFNKLDLSQLQGFSFGTQWTQEKPSAPDRGERGGERMRRDDGREGSGADRRDRRGFRRPAGPGEPGAGGAPGSGAGRPGGPGRRDFGGERRPRSGDGDFRGGPRREGGGGAGSGERGPRHAHGGGPGYGGRGGAFERGPYESPYYTATFYPEDTSFNTLVQTIRKSCRTVELFEIARTVVAKNDRFVVVVTHRPPAAPATEEAAPAPAAPAAAAAPVAKPPKPVFYVSVPDGMPFESEEAAVAHVLAKHLDRFFDMAEVEVDPPKGNFQVINRCGLTGELLGPPNYHRYNQIVQQHYAARVGSRMAFEAFRSRIETVRDPEVVNQWLAKMKKTMRYTWKQGTPQAAASAGAENASPAGEGAETAPAAPVVPTFDTLEDVRLYLLSQVRDKVVRTTETARFHGKLLETMPPGEIRRAVEGALERQRRFPLDTANALRGRLRREHFTIFKKGSKGISYVCAVKRKFRIPGQTFADSIGALIAYIEANPMVRASELAPKFLGIANVPAAKPAAPAEPPAPSPAAPVAPVPPAADTTLAAPREEAVPAAPAAEAPLPAAPESSIAPAAEAPPPVASEPAPAPAAEVPAAEVIPSAQPATTEPSAVPSSGAEISATEPAATQAPASEAPATPPAMPPEPLAATAPDAPAAPVAPPVAPEAPAASAPESATPKADAGLTVEERAKLARLQGDLLWLVREGYVTEFIDGRLFAPPPMVEARKKEIESEEHDLENFPEVPAAPAPTAAETPPTPPAETPTGAEQPSEPATPPAPAPAAEPPSSPDLTAPPAEEPAPSPEAPVPASEPPLPPAAAETAPAFAPEAQSGDTAAPAPEAPPPPPPAETEKTPPPAPGA